MLGDRGMQAIQSMNLNQFMEKWRKCGKSGEGEHSIRATDFFRHYFQEACTPTDAIKQYACRQSGNSGKKPELKDLPEHLKRKRLSINNGSFPDDSSCMSSNSELQFCDKDDTNATLNVTCIGVRYVSAIWTSF
ncbi:unnamed protein product [Heligmosomoides polygyrus]|uniref:Calglandulin n=1 Tax=Heligmosomoides polygyrus TaxID=6339 RepID=A0A183G6W9_HELPZ|nr:unnamed protein product [Heligmosomoides polygyrus]